MMQEFVEAVKKTIKNELNDVHTAIPGKIVSFNVNTGLATVLPAMKYKKPDGTTIDYPQITGVPVMFPQGHGKAATLAFPVKAGDGCLIVAAENSIDYWLYGQETDTSLPFDMTNSICIPGLFSTANENVKQACNENAIVVSCDESKIVVKKDSIQITASSITVNGNLEVNGTITSDNVKDDDVTVKDGYADSVTQQRKGGCLNEGY